MESTTVPNPTVDDVWNKIVTGGRTITCKEEENEEPDMMNLEDFLAQAGEVDEPQQLDVKPLPERLLSGGGRMLSFDNPPDNLNIDDDMTTRGKPTLNQACTLFRKTQAPSKPKYGIFFNDEFGDRAFQRWSDIDKVGMEALLSYLVAASMVKSPENARFSMKLKKLIAEHPDKEKLKSKKVKLEALGYNMD
uniref:Uncharacterized protein n=1 Tax=Tanacetum cinerariifolium TaxID=118510 RepID=A0A6L2KN27_TANCI|nr:hypothetical protein [Tanacetum cinerariifolium]